MPSDILIEAVRPAARGGGTPARRMWRATYGQFEFKLGLVLLVLLIGAALLYPHLTTLSATKLAIRERFAPPFFLPGGTWVHPLGTDQLGRDLFLRSLVGLQNALMIAVSAVVIMFVIGATIGLVAGYYGGWIDTVLMRITDAQLAVPLIILATIPLSPIGVALALWLTKTPLNVSSFMGLLLLVGIVVRNGILLIDGANRRRTQGASVDDALLGAARERLRPILMTTLAAMCGLAPLAFGWGTGSEMERPLAIAVIGGLSTATAFTLVLIPVLYAAVAKRQRVAAAPLFETARI